MSIIPFVKETWTRIDRGYVFCFLFTSRLTRLIASFGEHLACRILVEGDRLMDLFFRLPM